MEKSSFVNTLTIDQMVQGTLSYLRDWTKKEFDSILTETAKNKTPVIAPVGGRGYVVGNYGIIPTENKKWWRVSYRYSDQEYLFANKAAAVCFAVSHQTGRWLLADRILREDQEVGKFQLKKDHFRIRFERACRSKNRDRADLFRNRYQEASLRLMQAQSLLEKSLKSTKYF